MGMRENLQKLADKKQAEARQLELQLAECRAYIQAIQDSIKTLPKESFQDSLEAVLRPGTALAQAHDILKSAGRPLHILELLKRMGKDPNKANRVSLSGSMASYVRKRVIFRKTAPNTFGLIAGEASIDESSANEESLPESFGNVK